MDEPRTMLLNPPESDPAAIVSPLSVAFVSPGWPSDAFANGVIPYIEKVVAELRREGHQAKILAKHTRGEFDPQVVRQLEPEPGAPRGFLDRTVNRVAYRVSADRWRRHQAIAAIVREGRRLIAEQGLQLIEMEEAYGHALWVRRKLPVALVVRLHGPWFLNGPLRGVADDENFRARVRIEGQAIAEADSITSPSTEVLERTRKFYNLPLEGALVIPPPTTMVGDLDRWQASASDPNLILFVGRFDLHKGGDLMIEAFAEIARRKPEARLCFVGPDMGLVDREGERFGIQEYIQRKAPDAADRIEWRGQVRHSDLGDLRRQARVTVVCSRYETFGLTLTEAITTGCPTVATRAGAFVEIVEDGVNGLLCRPADPADLAEKVVTLLDDEALAIRLGRQGGLDGERRYGAGQIAQGIAEHYNQVIQIRNRSRRRASS